MIVVERDDNAPTPDKSTNQMTSTWPELTLVAVEQEMREQIQVNQ